MPTLDAMSERLSHYLSYNQIQQVRRAYFYAEQAHINQRRRSGEPYIIHPLAVANILSEMQLDHQSLMAAMLHDVIEDTPIPAEALEQQFGKTVTELVDGVSKLTHIHFEDKKEAQAENFQKMVMAMSRDIRVILVKLADRLHNMRTLGSLRPEKRRRIARETLDIYAPIASKLGLNNVRVEMEDLCFHAIHPMRYNLLSSVAKQHRGERAELINDVANTIRGRLKEAQIKARVIGREKHLYSIYSKLKRSEEKKKDIAAIMDVYGFRIITEDVDSCYRALGQMHIHFKPMIGRFKDYIAIPKENGYQSIHTTLFNQGKSGEVPIEIQIRTEEMDAMANHGIAAHWLYKSESDQTTGSSRARQWVQNLLELQRNTGSPMEFIEHVKSDFFPEEIYVFTPRGDIKTLPAGATVVDFAYAVHTDVGNRCMAARIDRKLSGPRTRLESGQTVKIVTNPSANPSPSWLDFVITSKARSSIRHYLKNQRRSDATTLGERMLAKELTNLDHCMDEIQPEHIDQIIQENHLDSLEALYAEMGLSNIPARNIAHRLLSISSREPLTPSEHDAGLWIRGTEGEIVTFAKCCNPIPGDPIVGHVNTGKGMVVHSEHCRNVTDFRNKPEKVAFLTWEKGINHRFSVQLTLSSENRVSLMADIATATLQSDARLESLSIEESNSSLVVTNVTLGVEGRKHLAVTMKRLRAIPGMLRINRIRDSREEKRH